MEHRRKANRDLVRIYKRLLALSAGAVLSPMAVEVWRSLDWLRVEASKRGVRLPDDWES